MAQAIQMQRKNDSGVYENYYPNTVMSQVEGDIQVLAKIEIKTNNALGTITVSNGESVSLNYDGNGFIYLKYGTYTFSMTKNSNTVTKTLIVDSIKKYILEMYDISKTLNDNDWATISIISKAGVANNYWSVGDCKAINLNGTASELSLNTTLYCYILGFNHDKSSESGAKDGITFGTFKTAASNGIDVALCPSNYGNTGSGFCMNTIDTNSGGWKNSYMRYTVLGSTDTQNGDATSTTVASPKANTLMSCLPSDLRAMMRPMYVYTDNTGGSSDMASYVTGTLDYLPLLAEYEVHGGRSFANSAEQNNQTQYIYYKNGNSKVKYNHSSTSSAVYWWNRSPYYGNGIYFCNVSRFGAENYNNAYSSNGVAPMFKV